MFGYDVLDASPEIMRCNVTQHTAEPTSGRIAVHTSSSSGSTADALSAKLPSSARRLSSCSVLLAPAADSSGLPRAPSSCAPNSRATAGPPAGCNKALRDVTAKCQS